MDMELGRDSIPPPLGILESAHIFADLQRLSRNPAERLRQMADLRWRVAEVWLSLPDEAIPTALEGGLWKTTVAVTEFFHDQNRIPPEDFLLARVRRALQEEPSDRSACAALPFLNQLGLDADRVFPASSLHLKGRLLPMLLSRGVDAWPEESEGECRRLEAVMDQILAWLPEIDGEARDSFLAKLRTCHSMFPFYFQEWDIPRVAAKRARLLEAVHAWPGLHSEYAPSGPIPANRRIRVGILVRDFDARPETYALLPVFEQLDRSRFEIILMALDLVHTPTASYCASKADGGHLLPQDLPSMVAYLRALDLDILLFGNNLSKGLDQVDAALALHRLARIQVNFVCSPITSGSPRMDYFLQGYGSEKRGGEDKRYTERLARLAGSGFCFSFPCRNEDPGRILKRSDFGLTPKDFVFVSGANYFKVGVQVKQAWSRILAAVPGSLLLLYPFGPAWSKEYPKESFVASMLEHFSHHGVASDRLVVVGQLQNLQEIQSLLRCADVYLDSFPYSGAASLQDPLDAGLPAVVMEGRELRFRKGASLLWEAGLEQMVASSPEAYERLAVRLGLDEEFRSLAIARVKAVMGGMPPFRNVKAYGSKVAAVFEELVAVWNKEWSHE
jgi:hypothetical protein